MPYKVVSKHVEGATLKEIAGDLDIDFSNGQGFYELIKKEKVSAKKSLVLFKNGMLLSDDLAEIKELCGLSISGDLNIEPKHIPANHQLFVQSTSPNHKISEDASVLFEVTDLSSDEDEDDESGDDSDDEEDDSLLAVEVASSPPLIHQRSDTFQFTAFQASFLTPIVSDWVKLMDLNSLDTALTNKNQRNIFLSLLSSKGAVFQGKMFEECDQYYPKMIYFIGQRLLKWVILRSMKLDHYYGEVDEILKTYKDSIDLPQVKSLNLFDDFHVTYHPDENGDYGFNQEAFDRVVSLVNSCPQLTSLTTTFDGDGSWYSDNKREIRDAVKLLTHIDSQIVRQLHRIPIIVEDDFEFVAEHCSNLKALALVSPITDKNKDRLDAIIKSNPNIKSICFGVEVCDAIECKQYQYFKDMNLDFFQFANPMTEDCVFDPKMDYTKKVHDDFLQVFTDVHTLIVRCYEKSDNYFTSDITRYTYNAKEGSIEVFYKQYELKAEYTYVLTSILPSNITTIKLFSCRGSVLESVR